MSRLGIRRRLLLLVVASVVVMITGLVAGFNIVLARTLDSNARALVRSRAEAELNSLRVVHGRLTAPEGIDTRSTDAYLWVFAGKHALERPRASPLVQQAVESLVGGPAQYANVPSTDTRLYAAPIAEHGTRVGTVVAGLSLSPYEDTRDTALISSLVFGGLVLLFVGGAAWWVIGASLRPVVRMTRQAAAWSDADLDHRFALGPPHDELTELAATLDGLLDRLAASLRRERRFSAELSHELRTPLARVLAQSELALRRQRDPEDYQEALALIHGNAAQLARTVDALIAAARYEVGGDRGTSDAESVASEVVASCAGLADERELEVDVAHPASPLRVGVESELAERILHPVIENACRYASTEVRVSMTREDSIVVYVVEDDGPGVTDDEQERIFEPGARGTAGSNGNAGAGLGLSLARRLARSVDGEVEAGRAPRGARFLVRLPTG